jgi:hypothetical protein
MVKRNKKRGKGQVRQNKTSWTKLTSVNARANATEVRRLTSVTTLTAGAGGTTFTPVGQTQMKSAGEWSSYSARYSEFRMLAIRLSVVPLLSVASNLDQVIFGTDRSGSAAAPTTVAGIFQLTASKVFNGQSTSMIPIRYEGRAIDLEDQLYTAVGTAATSFILYVGVLGTASTAVASLYAEFMCEFKGPQ